MATDENQSQSIILDVLIFLLHWIARRRFDLFGEFSQGRIVAGASSHAVDRFEASGRDEPGSRIGRYTVMWPLLRRRCESFVQGFFGCIEIAKQTNQCGQHVTRLGTIDFFHPLSHLFQRFVAHGEFGYAQPCSLRGRTSTLPKRAAGNCAATRIASFKSGTSIMRNPPSCSVVSANGPSVADVLPSLTLTVIAVSTG